MWTKTNKRRPLLLLYNETQLYHNLFNSVLFLDGKDCPYIDPMEDPYITPFDRTSEVMPYTEPRPKSYQDSGIADTST